MAWLSLASFIAGVRQFSIPVCCSVLVPLRRLVNDAFRLSALLLQLVMTWWDGGMRVFYENILYSADTHMGEEH